MIPSRIVGLFTAAILFFLTAGAAFPAPQPGKSLWVSHPALIQGLHQVTSKTPWQGVVYLKANPALIQAAHNVSNPASPQFHHFLTPAQIQQRFGPLPGVVASVEQQLSAQGFHIEGRTALGLGIRVRATAAVVNRAWSAGVRGAGPHLVATRPVYLKGPMAQTVSFISDLSAPPSRPANVPIQPRPATAQPAATPTATNSNNNLLTVSVNGPSTVPTGQSIRVAVHAVDSSGQPLSGWKVSIQPTSDVSGLQRYFEEDLNGQGQLDQNGNDVLVLVLAQPFSVSWQVTVTDGNVSYSQTVGPLDWQGPAVDAAPLTPGQVNQAYGALSTVSKAQSQGGMRIGIYAASAPTLNDLTAFEQRYGLPASTVNIISVDGGEQQVISGWHSELMLDMERSVSSAPGATLDIYTVPPSASILDAVAQAVQDNLDSVFTFSVVEPETILSDSELSAWQTVLAQGALAGMTFVAASGDSGAYADPGTSSPTVNWPAASQWVTGVGGTQLGLGLNNHIDSQWAWGPDGLWNQQLDGSGGGYSQFVSIPEWQRSVVGPSATGRAVPDVAFLSSFPYYQTAIGGSWQPMGGTSAAAPTWAGWVADQAVLQGRIGLLNPLLYGAYQNHPGDFMPVLHGGNSVYQAGPGYNPVTGLGSVKVDAFWADLTPLALRVIPSDTHAITGTPVSLTMQITDGRGNPIRQAGVRIVLTASGPGKLVINGVTGDQWVALTDTGGKASITLSSQTPQSVPITLQVSQNGALVGKGISLTLNWSGAAPTRISGPNRLDTAIQIAKAQYPGGPPGHTALLVSSSPAHLVDALAAAPLAAALNAPILLAQSQTQLGADTAAALKALNVTQLVVIGALNANAIAAGLPAGVHITQTYSGQTRFDTAALLAQALRQVAGTRPSGVFLASANSSNLVDALAADPAAALLSDPVLLVSPQKGGGIPAAEQAAMAGTSKVYVVGAATSYALHLSSVAVDLAGTNRFATAAVINTYFFPHANQIIVANGQDNHLVDALAGGPLAAMQNAPLVLVDGGSIPGPTQTYLQSLSRSALAALDVLGGTGSIPAGTGLRAEEQMAP